MVIRRDQVLIQRRPADLHIRQFSGLTATWDEPDRHQLAGYLQRLADELGV
jgi:hypothetical protein